MKKGGQQKKFKTNLAHFYAHEASFIASSKRAHLIYWCGRWSDRYSR